MDAMPDLVTGDEVIAAVEDLVTKLARARALAGHPAGLAVEVAGAVDAAEAKGGELTLSEETVCALRAVRDDVWTAAIGLVTPEDFVTSGGGG